MNAIRPKGELIVQNFQNCYKSMTPLEQYNHSILTIY